jgi:putative transposase
VDNAIGSIENIRDSRWTKSIAVGSNPFVKRIKSEMGTMAKGRKIRDCKDGFELREEAVAYTVVLGPENCDIA